MKVEVRYGSHKGVQSQREKCNGVLWHCSHDGQGDVENNAAAGG